MSTCVFVYMNEQIFSEYFHSVNKASQLSNANYLLVKGSNFSEVTNDLQCFKFWLANLTQFTSSLFLTACSRPSEKQDH